MNQNSIEIEQNVAPADHLESGDSEAPAAEKKPLHEQPAHKPSMLWMLVPLLLVGVAVLLAR